MKIQSLETVTKDVGAVCAACAAAYKVQFGDPVAGLGNARTATLAGGGSVGVRAPLRVTEEPVVRPYWPVNDIAAAVAAVVRAGGELAVPPDGGSESWRLRHLPPRWQRPRPVAVLSRVPVSVAAA